MEKFLILAVLTTCLLLNLAIFAPAVSFYLDVLTNLQGYLFTLQIIFVCFLLFRFLKTRQRYLIYSILLTALLSLRIFSEVQSFYLAPITSKASESHNQSDLSIYFAELEQLSNFENLKQQLSANPAKIIIIKNNQLAGTQSQELARLLAETTGQELQTYQAATYELLIASELGIKVEDQNFSKKNILPHYLILEVATASETYSKLVVYLALSPWTEDNFHSNKAYCRRLATIARNNSEPNITLGNFEATPYSRCYNWFTASAAMRDTLWGQGLVKTWKASNSLINFKTDHIFYSEQWNLEKSAKLASLDNLHYPQFASFARSQSLASSDSGTSDKSLPANSSID